MKKIVFVPVGIRLPTPFASRSSSFANKRCQFLRMSMFCINFLYVITSPVFGSKIALVSNGTDVFMLCSYGSSRGGGVTVVLERLSGSIVFALQLNEPLTRLLFERSCRLYW